MLLASILGSPGFLATDKAGTGHFLGLGKLCVPQGFSGCRGEVAIIVTFLLGGKIGLCRSLSGIWTLLQLSLSISLGQVLGRAARGGKSVDVDHRGPAAILLSS